MSMRRHDVVKSGIKLTSVLLPAPWADDRDHFPFAGFKGNILQRLDAPFVVERDVLEPINPRNVLSRSRGGHP